MKPAFYIIGNSKTGKFVTSSRGWATWGDLQQVEAHFARPVGAQKVITKMQSEGEDVSDVLIYPVTMVTGEPIKPKVAKQKLGFVIKILRKVPKTQWDKARTDVFFYKGNKSRLPQTVQQIFDDITKRDLEKGYFEPMAPYKVEGRLQSALSSANYQWTAHSARAATELRATIYPSREAAQATLDIHEANLKRYFAEYLDRDGNHIKKGADERETMSIEQVK